MLTPIKKTIDMGDGRVITLETGKLAKQADGAVELRLNNTMLLATVVSAKEAGEGVDFMPLTVEYKENFRQQADSRAASPSVKDVLRTTKFSHRVWLTVCCVRCSPITITPRHS